MNIALTATCNRSCGYCFAMERLEDGSQPAVMAPSTFDSALEIVQRSGIAEVRLLGGEPTLHPEFARFLERSLARGLRVLVFSGGLIPAPVLDVLAATDAEKVLVLVNVLDPAGADPSQVRRQAAVFARLRRRVLLGLNIPSPAVRFDFLLDLIAAHDLARTVRLGISHPVLFGGNAYLHQRHYQEVGRRITAFGERAAAAGVELEFDCGFVPCMFPPGALAFLGKGPLDVGLRCNPILDVLPDGRVISCFPLAAHASVPLPTVPSAMAPSPVAPPGVAPPGVHSAADLRRWFTERQAADRRFHLFRECEDCAFRARGECTGGCLSASLRRQRRAPLAASAERGEPR